MRSGNSMTTCCVVNANILNTLINLDNSKHCSRAISRLSEGRKIHVLSHSIDYPLPLSPSSCSAHVRLPGTKDFQKNFPQKNTSQYPWLGEEIRDWPCLKDFGAFMVNQCAVLWCGRNLRVATAHSNLPCFALCRKTTPNKQRTAKPYKNEFSPGYREQATTRPKFT